MQKLIILGLLFFAGCVTHPVLPISPPTTTPAKRPAVPIVTPKAVHPFVVPVQPPAASVTLAWDKSPDASVTGYNLYWGTGSRLYTNSVFTAATTQSVNSLVYSTKYFFAVTATNNVGLESNFSDEVTYAVPSVLPKPSIAAMGLLTIESTTNLSNPLWKVEPGFGAYAIEPGGPTKVYRLKILH